MRVADALTPFPLRHRRAAARFPFALSLSKRPIVLSLSKGLSLSKRRPVSEPVRHTHPFVLSLSKHLPFAVNPFALSLSKRFGLLVGVVLDRCVERCGGRPGLAPAGEFPFLLAQEREPKEGHPDGVGPLRGLLCGARTLALAQNSLRALRALRSDSCAKSDHEGACATAPKSCAPRRLPR